MDGKMVGWADIRINESSPGHTDGMTDVVTDNTTYERKLHKLNCIHTQNHLVVENHMHAYSGKSKGESSNSTRPSSVSLSPSLLPPSTTMSELAVDVADVHAVFDALPLQNKSVLMCLVWKKTDNL